LVGRAKRRAMHLRAAAHYATDEPDQLRSAIHYERGGDATRSAQLATQDPWAIINQGQMRSLRHLLEQFTAAQLQSQEWVNVNLLLGQIYDLQAEGRHARDYYQAALDHLELLSHSPTVNQLRARAYRGIGDTLEAESPQEALVWFERGLDIVENTSGQERAALLISLGLTKMRLGKYAESLDVLTQGLEALPPGPSQLRAKALLTIGAVCFSQSDMANATEYMNAALDSSLQLHDPFLSSQALINLGIAKFTGQDWQGALAVWKEAAELCERLGDKKHQIVIGINLGKAYTRMAGFKEAQQYLANAVSLAKEARLDHYQMVAQQNLSELLIQQHAWELAAASLQEVEKLAGQTELAYPELHLGWSQIYFLGRGDYEAALASVAKAIAMAEATGATTTIGIGHSILGQILAAQGNHAEASDHLEQSYSLLREANPYQAAQTQLAWAPILQAMGQVDEAIRRLEQADATFTALGADGEREKVRDMLQVTRSGG
jgi:tetratricopeptide (TPR) repeat protein